MAEPVRRDEPLSDVKFPESPNTTGSGPGPVPVDRSPQATGLLPETLPDRPLGEWPAESRVRDFREISRSREARLGNAGERVGSALGAVVNQTKDISGMVQDRVHDLRQRFRVIRGRRSSELKQRAADLSDEVQHQASELAAEARREVRHWEFRARLYARRTPFQFVAAAAAAGFVIGFLLRLWRDE